MLGTTSDWGQTIICNLELVKEIMARLIGLKFVPSTLSMTVIGTTPLE